VCVCVFLHMFKNAYAYMHTHTVSLSHMHTFHLIHTQYTYSPANSILLALPVSSAPFFSVALLPCVSDVLECACCRVVYMCVQTLIFKIHTTATCTHTRSPSYLRRPRSKLRLGRGTHDLAPILRWLALPPTRALCRVAAKRARGCAWP
jgi:hypothetical protein